MTVHDDRQSLLAEIESILAKSPRFSVFKSAEREQIRLLLESLRRYLVSQPAPLSETGENAAQQMAQVAIAQINNRLHQWIEPLQSELESLRQQRQSLLAEIQTLEQKRQQMVSDTAAPLLKQSDLLHQLMQLQEQSDSVLLVLDSTFRTFFKALEQDLRQYYDALSQGLDRMHSLRQQNETTFMAYFQELFQQLEHSLMVPSEATGDSDLRSNPFSVKTDVETRGRGDRSRSMTSLIADPYNVRQGGWYLGLEWDSRGVRAVLVQEPQNQAYPIAWSIDGETHLWFKGSQETAVMPPSLTQLPESFSAIEQALAGLQQARLAQKPLSPDALHFEAVGLSGESLQAALNQVAGVILGYANLQGESRNRLEQVVLDSQILRDRDRLFLVPDAIAALITHGEFAAPPSPLTALVIHIGANETEMALLTLPAPLSSFIQGNWTLSRLAYGGTSLLQDLLCQLIYPQWTALLHPCVPELDQNLPQPGTADSLKREALSLRLQDHPIGQACLKAAHLAQLILQQQETFTCHLGQQPWGLKRQDVADRIVRPFLQELGGAIAQLLSQAGTSESAIGQVICYGHTTSLIQYALAPWLAQKFPHATLI